MKKIEEIFDDYLSKTRKDIKEIDKLCYKLDIEPKNFWKYYINHKDEFNEDDFLFNLLEYFYYFLDEQVENLLNSFDIFFKNFYFEFHKKQVYLYNVEEFEQVMLDLDFNIKKNLLENKIFLFFIEKSDLKIFNDKEIRRLKLENLS